MLSTTAVTSSLAPSQYEDEVTFTMTVTGTAPTAPTGTVSLFDGMTLLGTVGLTPITSSASTAAFVLNTLTPGVHAITGVYSGDGSYTTSTSPVFLQQVAAVIIPANTLPGFALIASFNPDGDINLPPAANLYAAPATASVGQSITLIWSTTNVGQVQITGNNGVDPSFDTGRLSTNGSGAYVVGNGFTTSIVMTMICFDRNGLPLGLASQAMVTIT